VWTEKVRRTHSLEECGESQRKNQRFFSVSLGCFFAVFSRENCISFFLLLKERKKTITRGSFSWGKVRFKEELQPAENKRPKRPSIQVVRSRFFLCVQHPCITFLK